MRYSVTNNFISGVGDCDESACFLKPRFYVSRSSRFGFECREAILDPLRVDFGHGGGIAGNSASHNELSRIGQRSPHRSRKKANVR